MYFLCSLEVVGLFLHNNYYVVSSLFAASNAFDFCGDPRLVEACRREFVGDVLFL